MKQEKVISWSVINDYSSSEEDDPFPTRKGGQFYTGPIVLFNYSNPTKKVRDFFH